MGRKAYRKCIGALLIIASLIVSAFPVESMGEEESKSQTSDFQLNGDILVKYTGTANTVSVPDGIKTIGEEAFLNNTEMTVIKLPASLEKISYAAFSGCNHLKEVVVPNSVEEIGTAAFCNCTELNKFDIGKGTKKIGTGLFTGCESLGTISGNDRFVCENGVIYNKGKDTLYEVLLDSKVKKDPSSNDYVPMTSYEMPDTVTNIMPYAFYGCKNIEKIKLSVTLKEIPAYSFSYCNGLNTISIPYSVNSIDVKAFEYCVNLEDVDIPLSVNFIHETAFDGCSKLNIKAPEGSYAENWFKHFDKTPVNIIDNEDNGPVKRDASGNVIDEKAFVREPIEGLIGETIIVGRQAVFFIDNTKQTVLGSTIDDTKEYAEMVEQMETVLQTETNGKGLCLPKFAVIDNLIAGKAFYADETLTEYEIPKKVTSIGDFSFARSNLTEITIPESVTHIGYGAFYHCDNLSKILVPSTVTDIEPSAFEKTRMLDNWRLYGESDFLIMGDGILVSYKGSASSVNIPSGVKQIGPEVFKGNKKITEVNLPDSVWRICEDAFCDCSNLSSVSGGMNLEVIEDRAFCGCPLKTVRIVDTVRKIGLGAFDLSDTSLYESDKAVYFYGNTLPLSSYNKTTTRLTNSSYRKDSFEGIHVAIVNSEDVNRLNSVLDRNESGFSGLICVITEPNTEYFNGTLKIIDCTLTKEEAENIYIPETVYIYGKGYNFNREQLDSVISMARSGAYFEEEEETSLLSFNGSNEKFVFDCLKDSYVNISVKEAYKRIYGDTVPGNLSTYTIYLTDKENNVRISKFGKQTLPVSIVLPENMPTTNLHVICLDEYEQLEDLPFKVCEHDGSLCVDFDISHTGYYGIYSFNSTAVSLFNLDESPDTGDLIHPKWFLALGLFSLGLVLILIKGKEKEAVV